MRGARLCNNLGSGDLPGTAACAGAGQQDSRVEVLELSLFLPPHCPSHHVIHFSPLPGACWSPATRIGGQRAACLSLAAICRMRHLGSLQLLPLAEMPQKGPQSCPVTLVSLQLFRPSTSLHLWHSNFKRTGINFSHVEFQLWSFPAASRSVRKSHRKLCATQWIYEAPS